MYIDRNAKVSNSSVINYVPAGIAISAISIGTRALKDVNRSDTFVKTAKNCVKDYTLGNKKDLTSFLGEFLNLKSFAEKVDKVGNKKMFALIFGVGALSNALVAKCIADLFHKN